MKVEQIYTGCLAQGAYYIESAGEAAIIDPLREIAPYMAMAKERGAKIKYILETHFHADFVSGHVTLAEESGATIVYGPEANPSFESKIAQDGEILAIGEAKIKVLHTPGHTLESTTYLLLDEAGNEQAIFTGDTLFLGDVGRPDLAQKSDLSQEDLAGMLFESLRNKIMPLGDDITVYPGHGAGSACGKNMMKETIDSLGNQKKVNYALREDMTKEEFIKEVTDGLLPPPAYFPANVKLNKEGYRSIDEVMGEGNQALGPDEFEQAAQLNEAIILDVRHENDFMAGHIPGSIFIGLDGDFAPWAGTLLANIDQKILLVAEEGRIEEAITRLARVGFDQVLGYLKGGFSAWQAARKEIDQVRSLTPAEFAKAQKGSAAPIIDVRKPSEYQISHWENADNIPLAQLNEHTAELAGQDAFFLHCAGGYRSVIALSILKARGIHQGQNIAGGFDEMLKVEEAPIHSGSTACSNP